MTRKRIAVPAKRRSSKKVPATSQSLAPKASKPNALAVARVVGIGASAGGLEALRQFLANVPGDSALAFVVIQHQDPKRKSMLAEMLQPATTMRVQVASHQMLVKPSCVYIAPPNKDISLSGRHWHLIERAEPHGLGLPIDFLFRSLAHQQHELAIGVVLSGMGSDGALGLASIKEHFGLTLVQQPENAHFDSMPRAAINAGVADVVAPADQLPRKLLAILGHKLAVGQPRLPQSKRQSLDNIMLLLRARTGHDFSLYKETTIQRRIERRMSIHQMADVGAYVQYLRQNMQEIDLLFKELLIGVTRFFRDPEAWQALEHKVLPRLLDRYPNGRALRAWVAGCSTGEEAYSLAMSFNEAIAHVPKPDQFSLHIFATDLQQDAINAARQGRYPASIAHDMPPERLARYFNKDNDGYRISRQQREMVTFAHHDVTADPPFTRLDIVCCRNLLIYLEPELQTKLFELFHYGLTRDGILFLGTAESIGAQADLFSLVDNSARIYRRMQGAPRMQHLPWISPLAAPAVRGVGIQEPPASLNIQFLADQLILQKLAPPAVLVNGQGDIVYVSGRVGRYVEPAAGRANWNIHAMARGGLRSALTVALSRAVRTGNPVTVNDIRVDGSDSFRVDLAVHPIKEPDALRGLMMLVFKDAGKIAKSKQTRSARNPRIAELELALEDARKEVQSNREAMQVSYEQLQSANEELQSTNEELMTSKEEMQSMNEELQTVNSELQSRLAELSLTSDDMKNLLNSTNIATIFLTSDLHVRRFTTQAARIFKLLSGDTGRPLSDITTDLLYPQLQQDARDVLSTLKFHEKEVTTADHRWFLVRIMPYLTTANTIDGVVITFSEITQAKLLEERLRDGIRTG
jgi:two-component system CheB/CheR fusion protein